MKTVIEKLNNDGIDLNDCPGQAYDNAAVMSGEQTGVEKRILEINPQVQFTNYKNHSLNLACVHAAEVHPTVDTFFGIADKIFVFYSSSTTLWEVLKSKVKKQSRSIRRPDGVRNTTQLKSSKKILTKLYLFLSILKVANFQVRQNLMPIYFFNRRSN